MATALVTGASSGLGHEFAEQLAARGDDVVLVARDRERLERVAIELRTAYGVQVEVLPADLRDREQLRRVAERVADPARPVDLLVNNAGFASSRGFVRNDLEDEEGALDLMVKAVMVLSHAAARAMRERRHGAILNVSSVSGFVLMGHYSAMKSYVTVFSEALATELEPHGVTVTAVCPGFVHTEFHQRGGLDMSKLPDALWLDAPDVVREALEAVDKGKIVSVPSLVYKGVVGLVRVLPRGLVRKVTGAMATRRRPADREPEVAA